MSDHDMALAERISPRSRSAREDVPFPIYTTDQPDNLIARDYVVSRLLERENIALMIGYPETAKSTLAVDISASITTGRDWFGHPVSDTDHCGMYFAPERFKEIKLRLLGYEKHNEIDAPRLGVTGNELNFTSGDDHTRRVISTIRDHEQKTGCPIGIVVFDTMFDLLGGGDENHPRDMGNVSRQLQRIQREANAPVLVICHPSMDPKHSHEPRGHKSLLAKADVTIQVTIDQKTGQRRWRVRKANSLEVKPSGIFTCGSVAIDDDTAPVIVPGGARAPAGTSRGEVIRRLISQAGNDAIVSDLTRSARDADAFKGTTDDACRVAVSREIDAMVARNEAEIVGTGKVRRVRLLQCS